MSPLNAASNRDNQDQNSVAVSDLLISWRDVSFPAIFLESHLRNMNVLRLRAGKGITPRLY